MDTLIITDDCSRADIDFIDNSLVQSNIKKLSPSSHSQVDELNFTLRDRHGNIYGGIVSFAYYYLLEIELLWVHKDYQGKGYGSKLLTKVEQIAREKGCKMAKVDTFSFQAPDFYKKHGYKVFGVLDHFPNDHRRIYLSKNFD